MKTSVFLQANIQFATQQCEPFFLSGSIYDYAVISTPKLTEGLSAWEIACYKSRTLCDSHTQGFTFGLDCPFMVELVTLANPWVSFVFSH